MYTHTQLHKQNIKLHIMLQLRDNIYLHIFNESEYKKSFGCYRDLVT